MDDDMWDGYCEHGTYVGGCGIDWMCQWCEDGISWQDYLAICLSNRIYARVRSEVTKMNIYRILRDAGSTPEHIADYMRGLRY